MQIRDGAYDHRLEDVDSLVEEVKRQSRINGGAVINPEPTAAISTATLAASDIASGSDSRRIEFSPGNRTVVVWTVEVIGDLRILRAAIDATLFAAPVFSMRASGQASGLGQITFTTIYDPNQMNDRAAQDQRAFARDIVARLGRTMEQAGEATGRFNAWLTQLVESSAKMRLGLLQRQQWFQDELNKPVG